MAPTSASGDQPSDKDNWDNGRLARKQQLLTEIVLLRSYGVQTQGVDNSRDAIALIAFGAKFNLIIIKKILPIMNGLEADSLNGSGCKILGVTACSGESERQAFLAIGVDVFIEKPLDPEHLVPILRELDG
ncbi:hypothetical protein Gotri_021437, partial [Gossypium trilobum]|nr:hypothetical protein [Gossypium trilobum]